MSQRPRGEKREKLESGRSNQNIVTNEKFWKKVVMNEEFVQNSVMNAQIDPKVVMDGGCNNEKPSNQSLLEEFVDENEQWLLIEIPNRDPFFVTQDLEGHSASSDQHTKKFVSLREGLHVMMQCCMRQHFGDRYRLHEHPRGHASWRDPTMRKFTKESTTYFVKGPVCRWNIQKMRSESSEYVRKTTVFTTNSWRIKKSLGELHLKSMRRKFGRAIG